MSELGEISSAALQQYLAHADKLGLDTAAALASAGIQSEQSLRPEARVDGRDFQRLLKAEPYLLDRRRRAPWRKRTKQKILRIESADGIHCPRCMGRRLRNNGTYRNRRYYKCVPCSERGAKPAQTGNTRRTTRPRAVRTAASSIRLNARVQGGW